LCNLQALDPLRQGEQSARNQLLQLAKMFPNVIERSELGHLDSELRKYDKFDFGTAMKTLDICQYWIKVGNKSDSIRKLFPTIYKLVKSLLVIPHGNAEFEQLFSRLKLLKTKFKSCMTGETLNAVLTVNFNDQQKCHQFKPTQAMISLAKNATTL